MRDKPFALLALPAMLAAGFAAHAACTAGNPNAQVSETTPTSGLIDNSDGTVTHAKTGLMWKKCPEGLTGAACTTGSGSTLTWANALNAANSANTAAFAGHTDWRLPNKKELESIVEVCGYSPAINQTAFPATPSSIFWSSSSKVDVPANAWFVKFDYGYTVFGPKTGSANARLVRAGHPLDSLDRLASPAAGLPDTGQQLCDPASSVGGLTVPRALVPCSSANTGDTAFLPRQDGRIGRDAMAAAGTLAKTGAGAAGFDYTKVANNGSDLAAGAALGTAATDWACTRDNITRLVWEVKTAGASDLRYSGHTYSWYNSTGVNDGGNTGSAGGNTCNGTLGGLTPQCNTQNYVDAVNAAKLCGYSDWRLPSQRELATLRHRGTQNPSIDATYFPNTVWSYYWSGTPYARWSEWAWTINFGDGTAAYNLPKSVAYSVRAVRGGPF